ncbi:MAG: EF-Tu/IF-2/RF-3 family GTPase, partial [Candidatus Woesearchaeota archaeon]
AQQYRVPHIWHGDVESDVGKALTHCNPQGPPVFVTTKVVIDPQAGEIAAGRLFSGTLKKGTEIVIAGTAEKGRVQQIYIYNGAKKEIVDEVPAGNIIGISGPKTMPGDTITTVQIEPFEAIKHLFDPVITKAIEAKSPGDLPKLIEVLRQVSKEDPTITVEINEETGEHLLHGMGELHLEVIENRIKREKKVDVVTSPPIVVYRETILGKTKEPFEGKSPNKHNKLYFIAEPLKADLVRAIKEGEIPEGRIKRKDLVLREKLMKYGFETKEADGVKDIYRGNIFVDMVRGEVHIGEIMEMVLDMFEDVMRAGPLAREPCIGVKVTLVDTKLHEDAIHRGPSQMYPAVRDGIRGAMRDARPLLFEPMQVLRFEAPEEYMGEISKLISNKRGQILEMTQEGSEVVVIGKLPVAEMFGMSNDLRSATGGRGTSSLIDQSYERLPDELQAKVLRMIRERKGLKVEDE